jgi:hypothetical protein
VAGDNDKKEIEIYIRVTIQAKLRIVLRKLTIKDIGNDNEGETDIVKIAKKMKIAEGCWI